MKLSTALLALAASALASTGSTVLCVAPARDATVSYNTFQLADGRFESLVPKGKLNTLVSFKGNRDYERVLLGFDMPAAVTDPSCISKCVLRVPVPSSAPDQDYSLTAFAVNNAWEEDSVNAATKLSIIKEVGSVNIPKGTNPGDIDVTDACKTASAGKLSLFIDTSQPFVAFNSRESCKDTFKLDITY
ncbi:hypothetical protein GGI12_004524 [Dipsacomyces acuminosporus]|nr:hypothetical protein GGI12_004524 [Dipsacomyces acuminosporus]